MVTAVEGEKIAQSNIRGFFALYGAKIIWSLITDILREQHRTRRKVLGFFIPLIVIVVASTV